MTDFYGIEITIEDPAAEARAELGELKSALEHIEGELRGVAKPSLWQRVKEAIPHPSIRRPAATQDEVFVQNLHEGQPPSGSPLTGGSAEAADLLAQDPLFLDYETTGLNRRTDRVCEVTVIDAQGRVLLSTLIDPQRPIPAHVSEINGITDSMVADAPTWRQVEPLLRHLLAGRVVVGHNAKFEAKFTPFDVDWVCSMELADRALGKAEWWAAKENWRVGSSLRARCFQCQLPQAEAHTSAGDCLDALRLVRHLAGISGEVELVYQ